MVSTYYCVCPRCLPFISLDSDHHDHVHQVTMLCKEARTLNTPVCGAEPVSQCVLFQKLRNVLRQYVGISGHAVNIPVFWACSHKA